MNGDSLFHITADHFHIILKPAAASACVYLTFHQTSSSLIVIFSFTFAILLRATGIKLSLSRVMYNVPGAVFHLAT